MCKVMQPDTCSAEGEISEYKCLPFTLLGSKVCMAGLAASMAAVAGYDSLVSELRLVKDLHWVLRLCAL